MAIPNYLNINRPEGIQQQIVTLIQYVERYYPEYVEIVREIIYNYVPVDTQKIIDGYLVGLLAVYSLSMKIAWTFAAEAEAVELIWYE